MAPFLYAEARHDDVERLSALSQDMEAVRCGGAAEAEAQVEATAAECEKQMSHLGRAWQACLFTKDYPPVAQVLQGFTGYTGLRVPKSVPMKMKKNG